MTISQHFASLFPISPIIKPHFVPVLANFCQSSRLAVGYLAKGLYNVCMYVTSIHVQVCLTHFHYQDWGQPSIYFPIGDHVNVSWCCSHTNASGVISTSHIVASHITKLLLSFRQILQFRFWDNPQGRIPPWKVTKTRPFLSMCYGDPSATEVPPCCETATKKLTFSTTSVLLLLNMPLSLSRATIFRRQKNPRRVYRPKIAGILFVCNEPEGKYYTVP